MKNLLRPIPNHDLLLIFYIVYHARFCSCKQAGLEEGISASLHYARDRERRQRAARIKRLIYGSFSGIPVLRQVDIATSAYWSYSAALVRTVKKMTDTC